MSDATGLAGDPVPSLTGASESPTPAGPAQPIPRWPVFTGVLLLAGLLMVGTLQQGMRGSVAGGLLGTTAPDFTLTTFDGKTVCLSDLQGHPVVINFWASWCPPCRTEAAALSSVARAERAADRAVFVGVNVRDWEENARRFLVDFSVPYANGPDPGNVEVTYGGGIGLPYTVFVAAAGMIARTWIGPLDEQRLTTMIDELA